MPSTITATTDLKSDHYLVTISINPGSSLPAEVFVYENTGTNVLGNYFGTVSVSDIDRLKIFNNTPIPTFGNKFVRYGQAKIKVTFPDDPTLVINTVVANLKLLQAAYLAALTTTKVITF